MNEKKVLSDTNIKNINKTLKNHYISSSKSPKIDTENTYKKQFCNQQ